jgi:amino acid transporter
MENEKPLLFVRRASGLRRAITPWQAIFFATATSCTMPWHYYLMSILPNWYPGINLPLLYLFANLFVVFEDVSIALIYLAMPRSGSFYLTIARSTSPLLGCMEGGRSYIGDCVFRGASSYTGTLTLGALFSVLGSIIRSPGMTSFGSAFSQPAVALGFTVLIQAVGCLIDGLGPGVVGKYTALFGILAMVGWVSVMIPLVTTGSGGVQAAWDRAFGAGAYNEVIQLSTKLGYTPASFSWSAMGTSLLIPVTQTWPYVLCPVTGEVQEPSKSIPLSMIGGAFVVLFINVTMSTAYMNTIGNFALRYNYIVYLVGAGSQFKINKVLPQTGIATYSAILASNNPALAGWIGWAPQWSNFADLVLNILWVSRPMFAMAMDRMAPAAFAKVHPRWHSPYVGSLFWFGATVVTAASCAYSGLLTTWVMAISWSYSFSMILEHVAEAELPFSRPHIWEKGPKPKIGGIPVIALTGALSAFVFIYICATSPVILGGAFVIALMYLVGAIQYAYYASKNKAKGISVSSIYGELPPE